MVQWPPPPYASDCKKKVKKKNHVTMPAQPFISYYICITLSS